MATLSRQLRKALENVVAEAREIAEEAAAKALRALAVGEAKAHRSMTAAQEALRNRLRAHGRQLGDRRNVEKGTQELDHLVAECGYEHWHRMLFARFLADNQLLIEPASSVSISIEEVKELARQRGQDWVALAGEFAVRMLPQVFRQGDPVLEVEFAPEDRKRMEQFLDSLPVGVFTADDSLGWTYQFWQAQAKDAINASGEKIGADELGPVTQVFTEDYMVEFLLHNTLGAWWAGKIMAVKPGLAMSASSEDELRDACAVGGLKWTYLRFVRQNERPWRPAAGTFDGWPKASKGITVLDPCMGSGHFLVFALPIITALRMAEEGLSLRDATLAVLRDNLIGLELDARCTQIAAFNLALTAWKMTGYEPIPSLQLACSGIAPNVPEKDWTGLAGKDERLRRGMARLYALFKEAPLLGSLINPRAPNSDLLVAEFRELEPLLERALAQEAKDDTVREIAVAARGLAKAAEILVGQFTLIATNVPYLGLRRQNQLLKEYCESVHPQAKADLATCFVERSLSFCTSEGSIALVTPQNWLFLSSYSELREAILHRRTVGAVARLGAGAFETIGGEVVNVALFVCSNGNPHRDSTFLSLDASANGSLADKANLLASGKCRAVSQTSQLKNPDCRLTGEEPQSTPLLGQYTLSPQGVKTGDDAKWKCAFWEVSPIPDVWRFYQSTCDKTMPYGGRNHIIDWRTNGAGMVRPRIDNEAVGQIGVGISAVGQITATVYTGEQYDSGIATIVPLERENLVAIWAFCSSSDFKDAVRRIDQKIAVTNMTLVKVPFDVSHWRKVAAEKYPHGLPKPFSSDPTQWLFDGHPKGSDQPLHVAVARLLGYRWPRQTGSGFLECPALGPDGLEGYADDDGIVCMTPLKGREPAEQALRKLQAAVYGKEWSTAKQADLLTQSDPASASIDDWLRDRFFEQHCVLFHQRPFVWHIWDGEREGFHALINYHKLAAPDGEGRKTLEKMTYAYLGDWIGRQKAEQKQGREGADVKLAAALHLQEQLKKIFEGEPPYDLFVRWKPLHKQAIGWAPDINDGVRMNIRPFVMAKTLRGTSIFRKAPKIKWDKDRGKEPECLKRDFPWFWGWDEQMEDFKGGPDFDGNRWNDLHYSIAVKKEAREGHGGKGC